jgi:hypothetical protein
LYLLLSGQNIKMHTLTPARVSFGGKFCHLVAKKQQGLKLVIGFLGEQKGGGVGRGGLKKI